MNGMTRFCETCGGRMESAHPLRICPTCLGADTRKRDAPPSPAIPSSTHTAISRLPLRLQFFDEYDLIKKIGAGGQGDIWKAWDFEFRREVAMKRLGKAAAASESGLFRFLAEAQIASQLEHPGILPIFDVGLDPDGAPFYTTQLLPGTTFKDVLTAVHRPRETGDNVKERWTVHRAIELLLRVCDVLAHAHSRGVIHRDLKPSNVLVGSFGDVRVIDWGSAHVVARARQNFEEAFVRMDRPPVQTDREIAIRREPGSPLITGTAGAPFTLVYVPPEILRDAEDQPTPATDVYAMGVMLYELLTGRLPYSDSTGALPDMKDLRQRIEAGPPPAVRLITRMASRDLSAICEKAMAHEKRSRYSSMPGLADDIRATMESRPVAARNPGALLKLQKWVQRNSSLVLFSGLVLGLLVVTFFVSQSLRTQRDTARQITALREGELNKRTGRWRDALAQWDRAEAAGYSDLSDLDLKRAEAWIVLGERSRARAEFDRLLKRAEFGTRRGTVLLSIGEFEMFARGTLDQGTERVREALTHTLSEAERARARGLLADSTTDALKLFRRAVELDPYSHSAHVLSFGLESLLGQPQAAAHLENLKILFPGEFSPGVQEALLLAREERLQEAQTIFAALRNTMPPPTWQFLNAGLRLVAGTAERFSFEVLSGERVPTILSDAEYEAEKAKLLAGFLSAIAMPGTQEPGQLQFPPLKHGLQESVTGLLMLQTPLFRNQQAALEKIRSGWHRHPDGFFPVYAANSLKPDRKLDPLSLLATQAELFEMGVRSDSIFPGFSRTARYFAVVAELELAQSKHTNAASARAACLTNLRSALQSVEMQSFKEALTYYEAAFELADYDHAALFLNRCERLKTNDFRTAMARVKLSMRSDGLGDALRSTEKMLASNPTNSWATTMRSNVLRRIGILVNSTNGLRNTNR